MTSSALVRPRGSARSSCRTDGGRGVDVKDHRRNVPKARLRALARGLAVVAALGLVAGCTSGPEEPAIPTEGLLTAEGLGPGEWEGPFPRGLGEVVDSSLFPWCRDIAFIYESGDPVDRLATWKNGQVHVQSTARRVQHPVFVDDVLESLEKLETCEGTWEVDGGERVVGVEAHGDAVVVSDRGWRGEYSWEGGTAVTFVDGIVVSVTVAYPEGTVGAPSPLDLLPRAVEASQDLPLTEDDE